MNEILRHLQTRSSAPRLTRPAPSPGELQQMVVAATRVPDHARLQPWRFIAIAGERRLAFGEVLESALLRRDPSAGEGARCKARESPLRAPLLVAVVARLTDHPKVPHFEQRLSAGCAAHALLLAAEASGYAGIWRTGESAFDRRVMDALGLAANEEIVGFLYLGTRAGPARRVQPLDAGEFLSSW
jgi:nitroreductase